MHARMTTYKDCLDNRADFVPLVFSADGCMGEQAKKYLQRVGKVLAGKWEKSYSEVMGFVMGRVSMAVARASSMCIRTSRNRQPLQGQYMVHAGRGSTCSDAL